MATVVALTAASSSGGCSSSASTAPSTSIGRLVTSSANAISDKIDLLVDIDNTARMGTMQGYLQAAIPDLINRLVNPNCVDATTMAATGPSTNGACPTGSRLEFPPVHDMHIGVVSSSLGQRLGDACIPTAMAVPPFANLSAHNDDQAHLLNRTITYAADLSSATEGVVADAAPVPQDEFLYWYPTTAVNDAAPAAGTPIGSESQLESDFTNLIGGVGVWGCGLESQIETWYRFLVQPDPYESLTNTNGRANWSGVDTVILQQRHDFLRPDSLVVVLVVSEREDREIDVRSAAQQAFNWMGSGFEPPRGTSPCGIDGVGGDPAAATCMSCANPNASKSDPSCEMGPYGTADENDWGYDLALRTVHMKAKYGMDLQYPIQRYVNGLTSLTVPDRFGEYPVDSSGNITSSSYVGTNDCTNPLFAGALPDGTETDAKSLCQLPPGPRTKNLVFYAHIGGVPNQLLHFTPGNPASSVLTDTDWVKILGSDPLNYDYAGIDPHMIESFTPRRGIPGPGSAPGADPISGYDWITNQGAGHILNVDLEYACIFPLVDAMGSPVSRDCTLPENQNVCECPHTQGSVTADELPPICDPTTQTTQTGVAAYPTIRELLLAKLMGTQGVVSSICPQHGADNAAGDDPLYGYRPAMTAIIDRVKAGIGP
ncbi:MAG: hypothetical protein ACLP1X_28910 [Polyangiaceae bacterium]